MNGYDHMAMPYLPPNTNTTTDEYLPAMGLAEQSFHAPTYSTDDYRSINSISQMPPLASSIEADRSFTTSYHDFHYDPTAQQETLDQLAPESTSIDRDNELLNFQPINYQYALLDYSLQRTSISLHARLHGMFFMADPANAPGLFPPMNAPELTCYRRNLFQVTGTITLPRNLRYVMTDRGDRLPIVAHELTISATESVEGGPVKLISVPWKTPINSPPIPPEDKTEKEPAVIPLDLISYHDPDVELATIPFSWKRLQFRIATANNGRRKELQQHFVARLKVMAILSSGDRVSVAEARSAAIVVRGRSPRNFSARKDQPVGERATGRKSTSLPTTVRRTGSDPPKPTPSLITPLKRERSPDNTFSSFDFPSIPTAQDVNSYCSWTRPSGGSNSAPAFPTPTFKTPTLPSSKSPSSASPPLRTPRVSHSHPDEPEPKRVRQAVSKSPRIVNATQPSPQQPYKFSSLPPSLPSTRLHSSTNSPPTILSEPVSSGDFLHGYFPAVTQPWQPTFTTTASMNAIYSTPYLPHSSMAASAIGVASMPGGTNILPHTVTK